MRRAVFFALFCSVAAAESSLPPHVLLLSRIRRNVSGTLSRLPSYACLENINRAAREKPRKPLRFVDELSLEVIASGEKELFSWPEGRSSVDVGTLVPAGLASSGEFYASVKAVFLAGPAVIRYHGDELLNGVRVARYDYRVSPIFSGYHLDIKGRRATAGFSGSFWADPSTADLLSLSETADDIPMELGIRSVTTVIDYSRVLLGGKAVRFPETANVVVIYDSGAEDRNLIEFTHCREYLSESNIDFNAPSPALAVRAPVPSPVEFQIPPGLTFNIRLNHAIDFTTARIGDTIAAVVEEDVRSRKRLIVPKGALLTGRLRLLSYQPDSPDRLLIGLEFTDASFTDPSGIRHHAPFYAFLSAFASLPGLSSAISTTTTFRQDLLNLWYLYTDNENVVSPPVLPGVGTFFSDARAGLPNGFRMTWSTIRLARPSR